MQGGKIVMIDFAPIQSSVYTVAYTLPLKDGLNVEFSSIV